MPYRRTTRRSGTVPRTLVLLVTAVGCLGAVAYAAVPGRPAGALPGPEHRPSGTQSPRPSIAQHPNKMATSTSARFAFTARGRSPRFGCRLDGRGWKACRSPVVFKGLAIGDHVFSVRAAFGAGRPGVAARFRWRVLEPKGFSIVPQLSGLGALYPGAPPVALPVTIANPNPVPIFVTGLRAAPTADPQGCAGAENLTLIESSASSAAPLKVPANGSVTLPAPGVSPPAIQLRDLPHDQDACQGAHFPLAFSGTARG
ncbi:MAG TPA: hypothetical protein VHU14_06465 [Solirubrobacterales bacterium]|jgi:hypothetical protein|nr:hypothetical protein [Solirubrobacterales bacterium]